MHYRIVMPPHMGAAQILRQTLASLDEDADAGGPGAAGEGLLLARKIYGAGRSAAACAG